MHSESVLRGEKKRMRTMTGIAFIAVIVLLMGVACSNKAENAPAKKDDPSVETGNPPLVTFVEIGSVRCIPCKKMQPIMREIEQEYAGKVRVVFYDVWTPEGKPYGEKYGIRVIPTQVFLDKDGKEYFRHEGYFPKEELVKVLQQKGV
jgi:thioredoxin 1